MQKIAKLVTSASRSIQDSKFELAVVEDPELTVTPLTVIVDPVILVTRTSTLVVWKPL